MVYQDPNQDPEWPEERRAARVLVLGVDSQIKVHKDRQIRPPVVCQSSAVEHLFRQLFRMLKKHRQPFRN
jgi:hypothetical protein